MPWRSAPAWPVMPPPWRRARTSKRSALLGPIERRGRRRRAGRARPKYSSSAPAVDRERAGARRRGSRGRRRSCACRCRGRRAVSAMYVTCLRRCGSGAGCWRLVRVLGPAYTLSLRSCARPRRLRGSMPRTACRMTSSGRRSSMLAQRALAEAARVAGVAVVDLVVELLAGHADPLAVDDDDEVAGVDVRRVLRLALAAQRVGDAASPGGRGSRPRRRRRTSGARSRRAWRYRSSAAS